jgi:hypothetical protein
MVKERLANSKFIITSHRLDELIDLCQAGIVIMNGELRYFEDIKDAMAFYGETAGLDIKTGQAKKAAKPRAAKTAAPAAAGPGPLQGNGSVPMGLPITRRGSTPDSGRQSERRAQIESWFGDEAAGVIAAIDPRKLELAAKAQELSAEKADRAIRKLLGGLDTDAAIGRGRKRAHVLEVATKAQRQAERAAAKARSLCPWIGEPLHDRASDDNDADAAETDSVTVFSPASLKAADGPGRRHDQKQT